MRENAIKLVDLPGTYSLLSASPDEEVARTFLLFGQPDVTVIVADATCMERNLNLILQVLQITRRAVLCLNLMDEARAHGIDIDVRNLARDLGVPVVPCAARSGEGIPELIREIATMAARTDSPAAPPPAAGSARPAAGAWTAWKPTCTRRFPACRSRAGWRCVC